MAHESEAKLFRRFARETIQAIRWRKKHKLPVKALEKNLRYQLGVLSELRKRKHSKHERTR